MIPFATTDASSAFFALLACCKPASRRVCSYAITPTEIEMMLSIYVASNHPLTFLPFVVSYGY